MKRFAFAAVGLVLFGMGGFQALYPERFIRYNRDHGRGWRPQWMLDRMLSRPNVWSARIAGAACCIAGAFALTKAIFGF